MLPIIDFDFLHDQDLITVEEFIEAINTISFIKINYRTIQALERSRFIKTTNNLFDSSNDITLRLRGYPEEPPLTMKISKGDALKVMALVKEKEKEFEIREIEAASRPAIELKANIDEIKKPSSKRKAVDFILACISSYQEGTNGNPTSAEQLIGFCLAKGVDGYTDIEDTGGGDRSRQISYRAGKQGRVTWTTFKKSFNELAKQF